MNPHTLEPLLIKLRTRSYLDDNDAAALLALPFSIKKLSPGQYIVREGDRAVATCVLLSGFAYRQKIVGDGGRQIIAIQVPGDAVDLQNSLLKLADHSVQALTEATGAMIPRHEILQIAASHPAIAHAFWLDTLVDGSIAWEWIANVGRRNARVRLAHLLCEWAKRMEVVGFDPDQRIALPMTQEQIGDALGLTAVHVNRTIRLLIADGLIERDKINLTIVDRSALRRVANFGTAYLHLNILED